MKKFILFVFLAVLTYSVEAQNRCIIKGQVLRKIPEKTLVLIAAGEDLRIKGIDIPVIDNRFEYEMVFDDVRAYELILKSQLMNGIWQKISFHPKNDGVIIFTLYDNFDKNTIEGDPALKNELKYKKAIEKPYGELLKIDFSAIDRFNEKGKKLWEQAENTIDYKDASKIYMQLNNDTTLFTDEYNKALEAYHELKKQISLIELDFISKNVNVYNYSLLYQQLSNYGFSQIDIGGYNKLFQDVYLKKYPNHIYTTTIKNILLSMELRIGGDYIDFSALDIDGNEQELSSLIKDKIAVIDLWASW